MTHDDLNDDGYPSTDETPIPQEWLDEEDAFWAGYELDPADSGEYDPADEDEPTQPDEDEEASAPEWDDYNDPDNY